VAWHACPAQAIKVEANGIIQITPCTDWFHPQQKLTVIWWCRVQVTVFDWLIGDALPWIVGAMLVYKYTVLAF
jgi:hypothetical protein